MVYGIVVLFAVIIVLLGYAAYNLKEDYMNLKDAVIMHRATKNAPAGYMGVNKPDVVDKKLWEALDE